MFDFLSEKKHIILMNHASLGRVLTSPKAIDQFCENLHAFERDLCNPERSEEMRFTEDEIKRIEAYVKSVFSDELKILAQHVTLSHNYFLFSGIKNKILRKKYF